MASHPEDEGEDEALDALIIAAKREPDAPEEVANVACAQRILEQPPPRVGRYMLGRSLGGGTYGEVFRGRSIDLDREVALKRLRRGADGKNRTADTAREAKRLAALNHPNIVAVYDLVTHGDDLFIVMELVADESLEHWQRRANVAEIVDAYLQAGDGLAYMHANGVFHLDFKPSNVIRDADGRVRVADLGFARTAQELPTDGGSHSSAEMIPPGTRRYAPPEQRDAMAADARADQYSFCVALTEALDLAARRDRRTPPRRIAAALARGMSTHPGDRWPDMAELLAELRRPAWWQLRRSWAFFGATIFAVPSALAYATGAPACSPAQQRLAGRWDPQIRAQVADAFASDGAPWSSRLHATVDGELDAYATQWVRDADAACPATSRESPAVATAQLACLDRALERLGRTTAILADGRGSVVERADDLVRELTPLERCRPAAQATAAAPVGEVAEAIAEADRAQLWLAAGRVHDAREAAERAVLLAERTHDPVALAPAMFSRGAVLDVVGDDVAALEDLQAAAAHGIAAHDEDVAARAWQVLAFVAAYDLEDEPRAAQWLRLAEAAVVGLDNPPLLRADVFDVRGLYESLRGDTAASERAHRAALAELQGQLDDDDPRWTRTWNNLAGIRLERGDVAEARALMERILALRTARLGPEHPDVAKALLGLALAVRVEGRLDEALDQLARAETILAAAFGSGSPRLAPVLTAIADLRIHRGELAAAVEPATRAWSMQRTSLPVKHSERAGGALLLLLDIAAMRGDYEEFLRLAAVRRDEAVARDDALVVAHVDNDIAWSLCRLGRHEEARPIYAALRVHERKDPMIAALAQAGLGAIALSAGEHAAAVPLLEQALTELEELPDVAEHLAEVRFHLARALDLRGGASARVRALAGAALPAYRSNGSSEELASLLAIIDRNP